MGRKVKYVVNAEGRFQCEHCTKSYNNKQSLIQHCRLKHPSQVSQLKEQVQQQTLKVDAAHQLIHAKHETQTKILEVFNIFIHRYQKLQDEYVENTSRLCTETNQLVDKIIVLNGLSA